MTSACFPGVGMGTRAAVLEDPQVARVGEGALAGGALTGKYLEDPANPKARFNLFPGRYDRFNTPRVSAAVREYVGSRAIQCVGGRACTTVLLWGRLDVRQGRQREVMDEFGGSLSPRGFSSPPDAWGSEWMGAEGGERVTGGMAKSGCAGK
ncbi:hypothetical protein CYMTET_17715 [Cymbomonas tetramitiformis]|uniref:Uncharacterized protein n=1 Tax=Cymbomonas tetramitiformis TaxID=36881 RepID=A0AAE0GA51_9CHLO|nr:hypothetical protein CYMTET_17715 [Cymbomonas tetramitiformis]